MVNMTAVASFWKIPLCLVRFHLNQKNAAVSPARVVGPPVSFQLSFEQLQKRQHISGSNSSGVTNFPSDASTPFLSSAL